MAFSPVTFSVIIGVTAVLLGTPYVLRSLTLSRPYVDSKALNTQIQQVILYTILNEPWTIHVVLILKRFYYESTKDKEDNSKIIQSRKYIGLKQFFPFVRKFISNI